jgi:hypothetical protein
MTSAQSAPMPGSLTPILDRQAPLPPCAAQGAGAGKLIGLGIGLVIFASAVAAFWDPSSRGSVRQQLTATIPELFPARRTGGRIAAVGLMVLVVAYAAVAVHEIGHVIGGLCAGSRFNGLRIGPILIHRGFRVSLSRGWVSWFGGAAHMVPGSSEKLGSRALALVSAGPAASLISACAVFLLPSRGLVAWSFVIASMGGLADLVPFRTRTVTSDGARIWMLLRQPAQGERWLALLRLAADLANGVPPDLLPDEFLSNAIAVRDDSAETVTAHAIAYSAAFHRHRDQEAALLLETCLKHSVSVVPAVRIALASDSAVFQARRRHRPDLAERWLAELPATTPSWLRSRAEAQTS